MHSWVIKQDPGSPTWSTYRCERETLNCTQAGKVLERASITPSKEEIVLQVPEKRRPGNIYDYMLLHAIALLMSEFISFASFTKNLSPEIESQGPGLYLQQKRVCVLMKEFHQCLLDEWRYYIHRELRKGYYHEVQQNQFPPAEDNCTVKHNLR